MQSTAIENLVCPSCGAAARAGALYCYNCGGALNRVSGSEPAARAVQNGKAADAADKPATRSQVDRRQRGAVKTEVFWEPEMGTGKHFIFLAVVVSLVVAVFVIIAMIVR